MKHVKHGKYNSVGIKNNSGVATGTKFRMEDLNRLMSKASTLELTVYRSAIENHINKRISSSSEDEDGKTNEVGINTSDELGMGISADSNDNENNSMIEQFIADARERVETSER